MQYEHVCKMPRLDCMARTIRCICKAAVNSWAECSGTLQPGRMKTASNIACSYVQAGASRSIHTMNGSTSSCKKSPCKDPNLTAVLQEQHRSPTVTNISQHIWSAGHLNINLLCAYTLHCTSQRLQITLFHTRVPWQCVIRALALEPQMPCHTQPMQRTRSLAHAVTMP